LNLDTALWCAGFLTLAAVVWLLFYRCVWRTLPLFCVYSVWTLLESAGSYAVRHYFPAAYLTTYLAEAGVDSALQFCVLVELSWSVFRPLRASLSRGTIGALGVMIAIAAAAIWPFADSSAFAHFPPEWHFLVRLQQTVSILRILFFLVLAGFSQWLSIGWKDRELQVATGLGFYSMVALITTVVHGHEVHRAQYRSLDQLLVASYLGSLLYWVVSFAQQDAKRREFTPQMERMLLAVAGVARTTRMAITESEPGDARKR